MTQIEISIFFNLFHPSIDCSLVNTKFLEIFEGIFFSFIHMKLIEIRNDNLSGFLVSPSIVIWTKTIASFWRVFFLQNWIRPEMEKYASCVIILWPVKIQTCSAPQNDRLNLLFMEDIHVDGEKMATKGRKTVIYESQILRNSLYIFSCWRARAELLYK